MQKRILLVAGATAAALLGAAIIGLYLSYRAARVAVDELWSPHREVLERPTLWLVAEHYHDDWVFDARYYGVTRLSELPFWGANFCRVRSPDEMGLGGGSGWSCHGPALKFSLMGDLVRGDLIRVEMEAAPRHTQ